jgi:hypothetical protein
MMFQMSHMAGLVGVLGRGMVTVSQFASVIGVYSGSCIGVASGGFLFECVCVITGWCYQAQVLGCSTC